jgi:phage shock protein A
MDTSKIKSFWEKPEGNTGMIVIGSLIVGGGILVLKNIEFLIGLAQNAIYFGFLLGVIGVSVAALMNPRFRFLCSSMFQSAMRALTGIWIAVDPIGILKNYLIEMTKKLKMIGGYITQLSGQVGKVSRDIEGRKKKVEEYMRTAAAAKKRNDMETAGLQGTFAAREIEFIERRQVSLEKMERTLEILKKMEGRLNILYQDTENQVQMLTDEYEAVKASYKAMKGAEALINGDEAKALFDQACQYVTDDIGMKLGEMDRFMEQAKGSLTTMDLKQDVLNDKGLELLANWEKTGILSYESGQLDKVAKGAKVRVATDGSPSTDELEADEMAQNAARANGERPSSFSAIFNKKQ